VRYHHQDRLLDSLGKDTPEKLASRAQADGKRDSDFASTAGRIAPSLRLARSGINDGLVR
jgi:hypothetical protein